MPRAKKETTEEAVKKEAVETGRVLERVYSQNAMIDSDCYQLQAADRIRDLSWDKSLDLRREAHCHTFHTFDSNGREQSWVDPMTKKKRFFSTPIAGHFHEMELTPAETEGAPALAVCVSGPLEWVKVKRGNKFVKTVRPVTPEYDEHQHDVEYIRSERVNKRHTNVNAATYEAAEAKKLQPIQGIR